VDLVAGQRLVFQQTFGQTLELPRLLQKDAPCLGIALVDQRLNLGFDQPS